MNKGMLKKTLKENYGTLRAAAIALKINYYRLSTIINGWVNPNVDELKKFRDLVEKNERRS